jgi:hypothetical protein
MSKIIGPGQDGGYMNLLKPRRLTVAELEEIKRMVNKETVYGPLPKSISEKREVRNKEYVPAYYSTIYMTLAKTARELGYALTIHGSMVRDLDVVAIPWVKNAVSAQALVKAFVENHGLIIIKPSEKNKPHGRMAFALAMGGDYVLDLSVMPREVS